MVSNNGILFSFQNEYLSPETTPWKYVLYVPILPAGDMTYKSGISSALEINFMIGLDKETFFAGIKKVSVEKRGRRKHKETSYLLQ